MSNFWENKSVLVTGAGGFTGSHLCNALAENNAHVRAFVRSNGSRRALHPDVEVMVGDITKVEDCEKAVAGVDTVFNVAAVFRNVKDSEEDLRKVHVDAAEHLIRAAKAENCRKFVHTSTMGVHGSVKNGPGNEETEFSPGDAYQRTKVEGEVRAFELAKEVDLDLTVIRPCGIYGPGDMRFLKLVKPIKNRQFVMLGSGKPHYQFVFIDDLVDGFLLAGEKDSSIGEAFLIGGAESLTLNQLVHKLALILNVSPPKLKIPVWPVYTAGWLCEVVSSLFNIEPILHRRRVAFFTKNRDFSIEKAQKLLGYEPKVNLETGLKLMVNWYQSEGYV